MIDDISQHALVSVIMPTYNHARFIGESIESVLKQRYPYLELIVIDNYSEDSTEDIVMNYARRDKRVRYRKFRNDGLIANSRNLGIEIAEGRFVAFIDSDDLWTAPKIIRQLPLFNGSDVGLVYCPAVCIDEGGLLLRDADKIVNCYRGYVLSELLTGKLSVACSSVVVRKEVFDKIGSVFKLNRQGAEDWDLWLRIAEKFKYDYVNEAMIFYRRHSNSTSRKYDMMFSSTVAAFDDMMQRVGDKYIDHKLYDINSLLRSCVDSYLHCLDKYANNLLGDRRYHHVAAILFEMFKLNILSGSAWKMLIKLIIHPIYVMGARFVGSFRYVLARALRYIESAVATRKN